MFEEKWIRASCPPIIIIKVQVKIQEIIILLVFDAAKRGRLKNFFWQNFHSFLFKSSRYKKIYKIKVSVLYTF